MKLLDLFRKGPKAAENTNKEKDLGTADLKIASGIRVEVTAFDGRLLFVAKLMNLHQNTAELHQYSEATLSQDTEPVHVRIRGYNDHERKAIYMEGTISPKPNHIWQVEDLAVTRAGNDRAFFRLSTDIEATATTFSGFSAGEKPCRLLNISVGGACIGSEFKYYKDDKFLLKVKLLEDRPPSAMFCQVLRIIEKEDNKFEYGCQFLEMTEDVESKITQNIFAFQRQKRGNS